MSLRILDLQRRLREIGRIRIGEKVPTQNGKQRPEKIDVFRFTSRDEQVIRAAADTWGGTPEPWTDGPGGGQWQVRSTAKAIPVVVPPGDMSFSQAYEQWTAGGCKVRCDSQWDHVSDRACHCDPENRECKIHTRLSVILPDLPGLGVWRLESHGYYAAVELGGIVDLCAAQSARGVMLPARLRIEWREVKRPVDGRVQTFKFAVPVLDIDVHPMALTNVSAGGQIADPVTGELAGPVAGALPAGPSNLTPVPVVDGSSAPSIAAQVAAIDAPQPRAARRNAAEPLPSTGLQPRTAAEVQDAASAQSGVTPAAGGQEAGAEATGPGSNPGDVTPGGTAPPPILTVEDVAKRAAKTFAADYEAAPKGHKTRVVDRLRHATAHVATKGRVNTVSDCTPDERAKVAAVLFDISQGRVTYSHDALDDAAGVTFVLLRPGHEEGDKEITVLWSALEPVPAEATT